MAKYFVMSKNPIFKERGQGKIKKNRPNFIIWGMAAFLLIAAIAIVAYIISVSPEKLERVSVTRLDLLTTIPKWGVMLIFLVG